ncbi:MAG: shikimate dehydrogenase [Blastocatellia bacterium]
MVKLLICAPITESELHNFLAAIAEADAMADAVELRLDYLPAELLPRVISELGARQITKPLILTFRPREQGGRRDLTLEERRRFWLSLPAEIVEKMAFGDFELDLVESFGGSTPPVPWDKVICSWHNFDETPRRLIEQYDRMARTPAAVVKIATRAKRIGDCLHIFEIIERAGKPMIALAMGMPGVATRVLALSRGAMLTFGALRPGAESASGQPTVAELRDLYRAKQLSQATEIFGIIGNPVGHSKSPLMHNAALQALGRDGVYLPLEVDEVGEFVRDFVKPATRKLDWRLRGLSVTIPHKREIIPHLDYLDATARAIGAVNTVVVEGEELHGYNFDCAGAMKPLDELMDVRGARVAVIGAGGSARAVCYGLRECGAGVTIYARDLNKAQTLADEFAMQTALLESFKGEADVVINCTPIGMRCHSQGQSPIPAGALQGVKLVYDLIYAPEETALLADARRAGCRTLGGLAMLVAQAAEQFRLWTGVEPPVDVMAKAVKF